MTRVLSVASECVPLVKTGGLADVAGALPHALEAEGVEMRVLLPAYPKVRDALAQMREIASLDDFFGGRATISEAEHEGLSLLVLDAPHLYDRNGIYVTETGNDWADNPRRFAALCRAAVLVAKGEVGEWRPEVIHVHDWQGGFAPYMLKKAEAGVPSVLTIHNIAFPGFAPPEEIEALGLDRADFTTDGFEYYGRVSALKAGLVYADAITTVSPTYAHELKTPEFGMGFDGLLRARGGDLKGILNGIDLDVWNPADNAVAPAFKAPAGKKKARKALIEETGLPGDGPLAVVISRLTDQKGLDLLHQALPAFLNAGGRVALLGTGDHGLEAEWRSVAEEREGVWVEIGYDEGLAHRMIAGGDAVIVPSRFEPCGLTQLYGLRYGTIPVVARTGGLADTVIDANPAALDAGVATGIQHAPDSVLALSDALERLVDLYGTEHWTRMQRNAMKQSVGWGPSAAAYAALYRSLTSD